MFFNRGLNWIFFGALIALGFFPQLVRSRNRDSERDAAALSQFRQRDADMQYARRLTLDILQDENGCSAWFREVEPDSAEIFASLRFEIADEPATYVILEPDARGELFYKHPWAARTHQMAGRNATVDLNPSGAFFLETLPVMRQVTQGGRASQYYGRRPLTVGAFRGDTLGAQITTLLHELAHVVGRIPADTDSLDGKSGRNTESVLRHCKTEIRVRMRSAPHESKRLAESEHSSRSAAPSAILPREIWNETLARIRE